MRSIYRSFMLTPCIVVKLCSWQKRDGRTYERVNYYMPPFGGIKMKRPYIPLVFFSLIKKHTLHRIIQNWICKLHIYHNFFHMHKFFILLPVYRRTGPAICWDVAHTFLGSNTDCGARAPHAERCLVPLATHRMSTAWPQSCCALACAVTDIRIYVSINCLKQGLMLWKMRESMLHQPLHVRIASETQNILDWLDNWHCALWCYVISCLFLDQT